MSPSHPIVPECPHFPLEILERVHPIGCTSCLQWVGPDGKHWTVDQARIMRPDLHDRIDQTERLLAKRRRDLEPRSPAWKIVLQGFAYVVLWLVAIICGLIVLAVILL